MKPVLRLLISIVLLAHALPALAVDNFNVRGTAGDQIPIERHAAHGDIAVIWTPSRFGVQPTQSVLADKLAARGIEVWIADLQTAYFVGNGRQGLKHFRPQDIALLVDRAVEEGKHQVYLMSTGLGAQPVLRAARYWQVHHPGKASLRGLILFHPEVYAARPLPGHEAHYLPVVHETNLPVFILQPTLSTTNRRLPELRATLQKAGSAVYVQYFPGAVDGFHLRPVELMNAASDRARAELPMALQRAVQLLKAAPPPRHAAAAYHGAKPAHADALFGLQPASMAVTPPVRLRDLSGRPVDLSRLRGKVVIVNFWASWCPPCVREMPSMERLQQKMKGKPFRILAINGGEPAATVRKFMERTHYDFPVLLDPKGTAYRAWKVYVYPTSYLLDRRGHVRLASVGGLDWTDPAVVQAIDRLLAEQ